MWTAPKMWNEGTCYILGGGWSVSRQFGVPEALLKKLENKVADPAELSPYLEPLHDKHVIGINKSYQIGPWIDIMFFGDCNWYVAQREELAQFPGLKVSCCPRFGNRSPRDPEQIRFMEKDVAKRTGITTTKGKVAWNKNSGAAAISLAYHLGVQKIILLGFDMKDGPKGVTHWFGAHGNPAAKKRVRSPFVRHLPGFLEIAKDAKKLGIEIINASPESAIECFPKVPIAELFPDWEGVKLEQDKSMATVEKPVVGKLVVTKSKVKPDPKDIARGIMRKTAALPLFHQIFNPALYLEIGVDSGVSLRLAQRKVIGIDPRKDLLKRVGGNVDGAEIHNITSDEFFKQNKLKGRKPNLAFIDGLHQFEQVVRDFRNVEQNSTPETIVVLDDILPCHPGQTPRDFLPGAWTGDVWKIIPILKKYRPDLIITMLDSSPTGLMAVTGLDPENRELWKHYPEIVKNWLHKDVPDYIIKREQVELRTDVEWAIRNLRPVKGKKILCCINHYYNPTQIVGFNGGATEANPGRKAIVQQVVEAMKNIPGCDVRVCGIEGNSLVKIDVDFTGKNPMFLPYESLNWMRGFVEEYDYFINIEDDILLGQDVLQNIIEFDKTANINEVFLPNRIEHDKGKWDKVDLRVVPGWLNYKKEHQDQVLKVALNDHSGVLVLSTEKFAEAVKMLDPTFREIWKGGPMASALAYFYCPFLLYRNTDFTKYHTVEHLDKWKVKKNQKQELMKGLKQVKNKDSVKLNGDKSVVTGLTITYNSRKLIETAYNSIRQFHPTMPLLIIDGSEKNNPCFEYVQGLKSEYTEVIQTGYNIGHGNGMDKGLRLIKTKYALLFDSDIEMIRSPVLDMLKMMERDTFGVGWSFDVGRNGRDYGSDEVHRQEEPIKYQHPYFQLLNVRNYKKYHSFVHHGAPEYLTMMDIHERGLSTKILKDFPGLMGYTTHPFHPPWKPIPSIYVNHKFAGTRKINEAAGKKGIQGIWTKEGRDSIETKIPYGLNGDLIGAYNKAMESACTDWVLLLDQDVFLCNPYWNEMCLEAINTVSEQGAVITCVTNPLYGMEFQKKISEATQRADIELQTSDIEEHIKAAKKLYKKYGAKLERVKSYKVAGFFMLVRKSIWEDLKFKTINTGVQGVDWNFNKRILDKGYQIFRMPGLYVFHRREMRKLNWKGKND